jgi:DNA-binding transcriptional MerR regulator
MYTVKQLANLSGTTPRALRYYDQIGLLKPSQLGENGYRYYGEDAILRLQQILLYRELDLPLEAIQKILVQPGFNPLDALELHKTELFRRMERLERLAQTLDDTIEFLKGNKTMSKQQFFAGFSEEEQAKYAQEAEQKYDPATVRASMKLWKSYTAAEKAQIGAEGEAVYADLLAALPDGAASPAAQAAIARWRKHIEYFWIPSDEQLLGLAQGYLSDPRFKERFDRMDPALADFIHAAAMVYVQNRAGQAEKR